MSLQNKVHFLTQLRKEKKTRLEAQKVIICGEKMVLERAREHPLDLLIIQEGFSLPKKIFYHELLTVSEAQLKKITGLPNPEPLAAVVKMPVEQNLSNKKKILVLDSLSDPGNVGTLLRSALGLGFEGALLIEGSADPYNDKALRAAKGATFHLPLCTMEAEKALKFLQDEKFSIWVASMKGEDISQISMSLPIALILGSESHGTQKLFDKVAGKVHIPISAHIDSLNVGAAGSILMFAFQRKLHG